jgi:hypothetical protein
MAKRSGEAFVCESARGWKVVVSNAPYGDLHPDNMVIVADGLTREQAAAKRVDADIRLGNLPWPTPRKYA